MFTADDFSGQLIYLFIFVLSCFYKLCTINMLILKLGKPVVTAHGFCGVCSLSSDQSPLLQDPNPVFTYFFFFVDILAIDLLHFKKSEWESSVIRKANAGTTFQIRIWSPVSAPSCDSVTLGSSLLGVRVQDWVAPFFYDWARAQNEGAWQGRAEEEGGGLRSKWLSAGSPFTRLVPLTWLFLGF